MENGGYLGVVENVLKDEIIGVMGLAGSGDLIGGPALGSGRDLFGAIVERVAEWFVVDGKDVTACDKDLGCADEMVPLVRLEGRGSWTYSFEGCRA